jgi:excisionase family DNA binding protein
MLITSPTKTESSTYTVDQVAQLAQCSTRHVHRLKDAGQIPGMMRFGRLIRFSKQAVDAWLGAGMPSNNAR